ncbi:MAG: N-6 DNA methylase [Methanoregula sp.]|nr:N-6 DNA methylase [Methanoregula sp.]
MNWAYYQNNIISEGDLVAAKKKEETNDIIQYLLPLLDQIGISRENCKIDVTTEKNGKKRGDIWISLKKHNQRDFESNIIALIEAKHRNSIIGDIDWRDAMRQGKEKSLRQGLHYYIVTNCKSEYRFYNSNNDEEIQLDGKVVTKILPVAILQKIQTQTSNDNSYVIDKASITTRPFSESKFRKTLENLANTYRSAGLKKGDDRIDPTVSFVILKYISEKEKEKRTLNKVIKLWDTFKKNAYDEETDLQVEFNTMIELIWGEKSVYKNNDYRDFEKLISFPRKLKNEHYKIIYKELDDYHFHGANFDIFGAIYEEFASQIKKKEFGEFYTRRHITGMVARLLLRNEINPRDDLKICDPACGSGGFLTEAYKVLETNYRRNQKFNKVVEKNLKENIFWGYDYDKQSVARTKLNMFLVGDGHIHIYENDSLLEWNEEIGYIENQFDYILTNPPMGKYEGDASVNDFDFTNESRYELFFTEKIIGAVKNGCEIAVVLNDGALETPSRENFRTTLMKFCNINAIISLTNFAFAPYTKEKTYILFLQKKNEDDITSENPQINPIWHFILDYDGYANSDKRFRTKYHDDLPELESKFSDAVKLAQSYSYNHEEYQTKKSLFERVVNERERTEGLNGMKYGFVEIEKINKENFKNLLSEFYLRSISFNVLTKKEFIDNSDKIIKQLSKIDEEGSDSIVKKIQDLVFNTKIFDPTSKTEKFSDIFTVTGGNSGLTEEFIYNNQPTNEEESIKILSSATLQTNLMGSISQNAKPNNKFLKIFNGECIVIARNGYAGKMTYLNNGKFTTNDHAYVLTPKNSWKNKINLRWFVYQYQELFYNLVTSKSDNATFNKEYIEKQEIAIPGKKTIQDPIALYLLKFDEITKNL